MKKISTKNFVKKLKKVKPEFWLVLILIFALSLRLYFFVGLVNGDPQDDGIYMANIHGILKGQYNFYRYKNIPSSYIANPAETFAFRIGFLYPCAFFSILFGVSELSITLWPLICSLGMITVSFYLGRLIFDEEVGLLSSFLLSFFPLNVLYSTRIAVDIPLAFFVMLSFYFFLKAEFSKTNKGDVYYLLSGIVLGLGYLNKPLAIFLFLFYFLFFSYKLYKKEIRKSFIYLILGFSLIFVLEGSYYYIQTGHFFLNKEIVTGAYIYKYENEFVKTIDLSNQIRISYTDGFPLYYTEIILNLFHHRPNVNYFGFFYYFIFLSIIYLLVKREKKSYVLIALFIISFLYLEFGTAHIKIDLSRQPMIDYLMLFKRPRFLTILTVPALIVLASSLIRINKYISISIVGLLLLSSVYYINESREYFISGVYDIREAASFLKTQPKRDIYIDYLGRGVLQYYFGFKRDELIKDISSIKNPNEIKNAFVIVGGSRGSDIHWTVIKNLTPKFLENPPKNWKVIKIIKNKRKKLDNHFRDLIIYYVPP